MFTKLLIASRAEIACRIIKTARLIGMATVAVYSEADIHSLHVAMADEAYCIGPAPTKDSYLNKQAILTVAQQTGATALHPGYGFLSENAEFAEQCATQGICFIGPSPTTIRQMGEKGLAKILMQKAGVPVLPGYNEADQETKTLLAAAKQIGYPLLIKAVAGGGGRGMRVVTQENEFAERLHEAQQEARNSFGDDRVLLEKYLANPRHIEVQVFGDQYGNVLHLFERDCSIQRRHQKILEEAPAPFLNPTLRNQLFSAAIQATKALNYVGAGTLEFLVDEQDHGYFMEMNTRLQVEHPITERITGLDLVAWQLRIAAGEALPAQETITCCGHAFEARLYAEDPQNKGMPTLGTLDHWHMPAENQHLRIDSGFRQGDTISPYYDAMLAKIITYDENRTLALEQLTRALQQCEIVGVRTNIHQLTAISQHPTYQQGRYSTNFISDHPMDYSAPAPTTLALLFAAHTLLLQQCVTGSAISPWNQCDAWRLNSPAEQYLHCWPAGKHTVITVTHQQSSYCLTLHEEKYQLQGDAPTALLINGHPHSYRSLLRDNYCHLFTAHGQFTVPLSDPQQHEEQLTDVASQLRAPMPGTLAALFVQEGQQVHKNDRLLVIEAMKMEHTLLAPTDGVITAIHYQPGDFIPENAELLIIFDTEDSGAGGG